ncbi:MAG: hypothetical protein ACYC8T_05280 [Myxococcaceae bacterium]
MKALWRMAVVALALGLLGGCPKRVETADEGYAAPKPGDFYPLAVGNRWTYAATSLGEKREVAVEIVKEQNGFFLDNQGGQLTVDAFGVRDQKRYLLREPLEAGKGWTNVVSVSSVEHYKVIEVGQSCEVPAGRFEGCVRVEGRNRMDEKATLVGEWTFAPAVGVVRITTVVEVGEKRIPQTRMELREYNLVKAAAK